MKQNKKPNNDLVNDFTEGLAGLINEIMNLLIRGVGILIQLIVDQIVKKIEDHKRGYGLISIKQLRFKKYKYQVNCLGYSINSKKFIQQNQLDFSKHTTIFGATGFGKTVIFSTLQDYLLGIDNALFYFDPKADTESKSQFVELCKKHSKKCYVLSEDLQNSQRFNPLKDGSRTQIADRIMEAFEWSEPYYKDMCYLALSSSLLLLEEAKREICLGSILEVYKEHFLNEKNSGLFVKLKKIAESDFGPLLTEPGGITLQDIRTEGACSYLGISTQAYPETARAVFKIFLGELRYNSYVALKNNNKDELKTYSIFFDEFGSVVTPSFVELLNKCRAAKMQLFMAFQSKADIDIISPQLTEQIIENASNHIILKQRLDSSASFFSKAIGTYKTKKFTQQRDEEGRKGGRSEREVYEHIVHPDVIKNLGVGQCVLLRHNPTRVDLVNIQRPVELKKSFNDSSLEVVNVPQIVKKNIFEEE